MVESRPEVLGNSSQGITFDCGLHTCVVPVLLQQELPLGVFGETNEERKLAGIEMRRRVTLGLSRGQFMFHTEQLEQAKRKREKAAVNQYVLAPP